MPFLFQHPHMMTLSIQPLSAPHVYRRDHFYLDSMFWFVCSPASRLWSGGKKSLAIIHPKGIFDVLYLLILVFYFFIFSQSAFIYLHRQWCNRHFMWREREKKNSIFPLFMSPLWWKHVKAETQGGCLMLNWRSDGASHLFFTWKSISHELKH